MVGPVYSLELHHALRRGWLHLGRWAYCGWLAIELFVFGFLYELRVLVSSPGPSAVIHARLAELVDSFLVLFIAQHFLLILVVAPTLAAGSITDEKMRGALAHLLGTSLTSWQIIRGKWLAQTAHVLILASAALPVICVLSVLAGRGPLLAAAVVLVTVPAAAALTAGGLLASVWCRKTTTAILTLYAVGAASLVVLWMTGSAEFFNPTRSLEPIWEGFDDANVGRMLLEGLAAWGGAALVCLVLAPWRLRPAYMRQLEARDVRRRFRWRWLERPPVSDLPIRWKERYAGEFASLPGLRLVPRRIWLLGVVTLTVVSSMAILAAHLPPQIGMMELARKAVALDMDSLASMRAQTRPAGNAFLIQGTVVLVVASLVIGLRASGSVTGERERQTWEGLLLTPLESKQLIRGKAWGIIDSARPYLLAYTIPALALAVLGGLLALYWTVYLWVMTWVAIYFMAGTGVEASVRSSGSWRSLLATAATAGRALLSRFALLGIGCGFLAGLVSTTLVGFGSLGGEITRAVFISAGCLVVAVTLFAQGEQLLTRAEGLIAQYERVSQGKDLRLALPPKRESVFYRLGSFVRGYSDARKRRGAAPPRQDGRPDR
jgi:ABC-type transport system involved in multi-copper enzyme maturation permease subunit